MELDRLEIDVAIQISKPKETVFEAIVNPEKMTNYFISKSSGLLEEGKEIIWKFPEFEIEFPIKVTKIQNNSYISYLWTTEGIETLVEINLSAIDANTTLVKISEKSRNNDLAGLKWLMSNSFGWSNFLACLKAYLEYNINLRKGSFDFLKK